MKYVLAIALLWTSSVMAEEKIRMNFSNEELTKVIETYSKASKTKFILDPAVRGKITLLNPEPVTLEEAFNQISTGLALNGFSISTQGDTYVVRTSRNVQRDLITVSTELPPLKPEKMFTWIITFKNISATDVNRDLRILPSKDGEMSVYEPKNQIIITDYVSNLYRVSAILKELDKPNDPATQKIVDGARKDRQEHRDHKKGELAEGPKPKFPGQGPAFPPPPRPEEK